MNTCLWRIQQWSASDAFVFFLRHFLGAFVLLGIAHIIGIFTVTPEAIPFENIVDSDFGTIIGIIAGFITSLAIQWVGNYSRRKSTTSSLRKELLAELTAMDDFFQIFQNQIDLSNPIARQVANNISVDIYQVNIQQFGKLSSIETQAIILYYSSLSNQRALIRGIDAGESGGDNAPQLSHKRIVELNVIWRLVFDLILGKIEPSNRVPTRELTDLAKLYPKVTNETKYEDIERDLQATGNISGKKAQKYVEEILREGKLAVDTSQEIKSAYDNMQVSDQERGPAEVEPSRAKTNADP